MDHHLKSFLQYVFEVVEGVEQQQSDDDQFCHACGLTYGEFKKTGKLGCASCYDAFRGHISRALQNIHGNSEYKGRIPAAEGRKYEFMMMRRELAENKQMLRKAVEAEEFEDAAKYRDTINALTQKIRLEEAANEVEAD